MTPEQYVIRCDNLGIVRMVAEKMVKQLEKRRISKTKMDFVTDDLPNISKIMNDSHCRPMHQKAFELNMEFMQKIKIKLVILYKDNYILFGLVFLN